MKRTVQMKTGNVPRTKGERRYYKNKRRMERKEPNQQGTYFNRQRSLQK